MSKINKDSITVDKTHKTVKLVIPHAEREENAKLESGARERMEHKLVELNEQEKADKFAKMSVWDIFQPMISSVSSNYKLEVAFE